MARNYLKGMVGNDINANLAAAGFNFKGLLNKIKEAILWALFSIYEISNQRKLNEYIYCL